MKRKIAIAATSLALAFGASSCEELFNNLEDAGLTTEEVVQGLKTALRVGADSSVTTLSASDGYFADEAVKILLPPEADIIVDNVGNIRDRIGLNLQPAVDSMVFRINRAAEDAASEAGPIFSTAITDLSITQAMDILQGTNPAGSTSKTLKSESEFDSTAATNYLIATTYQPLSDAFAPKISNSLDKKIVGNVSTNQAWSELTGRFNGLLDRQILGISLGQLLGLNRVDTELGPFVTEKGLDGLFMKVGNEEKKIRRNPYEWALDILQRVFGSVQQ